MKHDVLMDAGIVAVVFVMVGALIFGIGATVRDVRSRFVLEAPAPVAGVTAGDKRITLHPDQIAADVELCIGARCQLLSYWAPVGAPGQP